MEHSLQSVERAADRQGPAQSDGRRGRSRRRGTLAPESHLPYEKALQQQRYSTPQIPETRSAHPEAVDGGQRLQDWQQQQHTAFSGKEIFSMQACAYSL